MKPEFSYLPVRNGEKRPTAPADKYIDCLRCGICCTGLRVKLSKLDIRRLASALRLNQREFMRRYVETITIGYLLRQENDRGLFLEWKGDSGLSFCTIYRARPDACRAADRALMGV